MTRLLMCVLLVPAVLAAQGGGQSQQPFRGTTENVPVYVTVTDKDNRLVTKLSREAFEVRDNGRVQPITLFDNTPQPVRLVVLLDVSGSMTGNLGILRAACQELFSRLSPDDRARVGAFGKDIEFSPEFTRENRALTAALPTSIDPNAPTPLWRAIDDAMSAFGNEAGRRVVLVLSDGKDSGPRKFNERYLNQLEIVDRARAEDVMIYGIGLRSRGQMMQPGAGANLAAMMAADLPDPGLGTTALETGGGYFEIRPRDDLGAAFARVADELHSQYLLGFGLPARDGKTHKVEVRLTDKDLKPRAKKTYQAPK